MELNDLIIFDTLKFNLTSLPFCFCSSVSFTNKIEKKNKGVMPSISQKMPYLAFPTKVRLKVSLIFSL